MRVKGGGERHSRLLLHAPSLLTSWHNRGHCHHVWNVPQKLSRHVLNSPTRTQRSKNKSAAWSERRIVAVTGQSLHKVEYGPVIQSHPPNAQTRRGSKCWRGARSSSTPQRAKGRGLMAPRTDRTTRIPSGVACPLTTNHAAKWSVFVDLRNTGNLTNWHTCCLAGAATTTGEAHAGALGRARNVHSAEYL